MNANALTFDPYMHTKRLTGYPNLKHSLFEEWRKFKLTNRLITYQKQQFSSCLTVNRRSNRKFPKERIEEIAAKLNSTQAQNNSYSTYKIMYMLYACTDLYTFKPFKQQLKS